KNILEIVKPFLFESNICIVAKRTVNIVNMKELLYLKRQSNILVVNDNDYDTLQTTEAIKSCMPQHNYTSYIRNKQIPREIDFVEIGRASCRERVLAWVVEGRLYKQRDEREPEGRATDRRHCRRM